MSDESDRESGELLGHVELLGDIEDGHWQFRVDAAANERCECSDRDAAACHFTLNENLCLLDDWQWRAWWPQPIPLIVDELMREDFASLAPREVCSECDLAAPTNGHLIDSAAAIDKPRPYELEVITSAKGSPWVPFDGRRLHR